ncbi:conserved hypothetical protein [Neospora caninum Liverpool]|uniref:Uncharacterized protein n=1 Tax=Neospora caninum (strain Liverpool) TaxID=572307 RepID=F0VCC2_NEOCL|nr:conserved hypothetical protein [Neospora caninum Liverpool]CBZ51256.1 conserved hypothetical protein [Neospora caninum Liverpool]|eukprot:XP_003881289.1 conserved hypothetical protein [Neospora caninum Liverpool]
MRDVADTYRCVGGLNNRVAARNASLNEALGDVSRNVATKIKQELTAELMDEADYHEHTANDIEQVKRRESERHQMVMEQMKQGANTAVSSLENNIEQVEKEEQEAEELEKEEKLLRGISSHQAESKPITRPSSDIADGVRTVDQDQLVAQGGEEVLKKEKKSIEGCISGETSFLRKSKFRTHALEVA